MPTSAVSEPVLKELGEVFSSTFGAALKSLILYEAGAPDLNVLVVLDGLDPGDPVFSRKSYQEWLTQRRIAPLYLKPGELAHSSDVFPMEHLEMRKNRRVLAGADVLAGLEISPRNLRHQIEYELRSLTLSLRGRLAAQGDGAAIQAALSEAAAGLSIIFKSLLRLKGEEPPHSPDELLRACCSWLELEPGPAQAALAFDGESPAGARSCALGLHSWLERCVSAVDRIAL